MSTIFQHHHQIRPYDAKITKEEVLSGIFTGQIAGLIMAASLIIIFTVMGKGPLFPLQLFGSLIMGDGALTPNNLTAVIVGLILHQLTTSLVWGLVYGLIAAHLDIYKKSEAFLLGISVAILAMVGPFFFLPYLMNGLHGFDFWNHYVPLVWSWVAHLIFGASFILYPKIYEKMKASATDITARSER